jgi:hypothetical protein
MFLRNKVKLLIFWEKIENQKSMFFPSISAPSGRTIRIIRLGVICGGNSSTLLSRQRHHVTDGKKLSLKSCFLARKSTKTLAKTWKSAIFFFRFSRHETTTSLIFHMWQVKTWSDRIKNFVTRRFRCECRCKTKLKFWLHTSLLGQLNAPIKLKILTFGILLRVTPTKKS